MTGKTELLVIVENSFLSQVTYYTWDATCKVAQHLNILCARRQHAVLGVRVAPLVRGLFCRAVASWSHTRGVVGVAGVTHVVRRLVRLTVALRDYLWPLARPLSAHQLFCGT